MLKPYDDNLDFLSKLYSKGSESERRMALYLFDEKVKFDCLFSDKFKCILNNTPTTLDILNVAYSRSGTNDPLNRALFVDFETLLPDQVLTFVDRLSMAHSVEVRTPFLDYRLIEYVASLPGNIKIKNGRVKHILKEAISDLLPQDIIDRPKEGFVLPINDWIMDNLSAYIRDTLSECRLNKHGLLNYQAVNKLVDDHFNNGEKYGPQLWNLVMFQLWWEEYFS